MDFGMLIGVADSHCPVSVLDLIPSAEMID